MRPRSQPHGRCRVLFFVVIVVFLLLRVQPGAASALATFAMAKAGDTTVICGLLPSSSSPLLLDLNCTAMAGVAHEKQETYPSTHPFSALAGGEDFLCAVGPSSVRADAVDMRWWELSPKNSTAGHGGKGSSKRVYLGPPLRALASSGYRVCGVMAGGELHCWRWHGKLAIPAELRFVSVAVGKGFVCAIVDGEAAATPVRCFGNEEDEDAGKVLDAVRDAPRGGSYDVVAAHGKRACALSTGGGISCWGADAPSLGCDNNGTDRKSVV